MTTNKALRWYDTLSWVHDLLSFNDWPYREARKQAIKALDLRSGDTVIDLNLIGHSDCRRRVWEPVQALTDDYQETWYPANFKYIQGALVVATGIKGT